MKTKLKKLGKVFLVGAGPGDPGLLTLRGARLLAEADVVIYDWLINPALLELAPQTEKIYAGKYHGSNGFPASEIQQPQINQLLVKHAKRGKKVVRLKGGDPFVFGRGGEEVSYLKSRKIPFEIVPGVSAGNGVPAYAGIPLTDRRFASSVTFVTAHEASKKESAVNWANLAKLKGTLVAFMGMQNLSKAVESLKQGGMNIKTKVSVIEWGTFPHQRVAEGNLLTIDREVQKQKLQSPALAVFGEVNRFRKSFSWFEKKPLFGKKVLLTRASSQSRVLRELLEAEGAGVLECPTIQILPPADCAPLDRTLRDLTHFDWVVFTSVNGVESVFNRLRVMNLDARVFRKTKIAVIGEATCEALKIHGLQPDFIPEEFTAASLIKELGRKIEVKNLRFFLPRTNIAPELLHEELEKRGAKVTEVIAYQTVTVPDSKAKLRELILGNKVDYVLFTSSSTVKNFFEALPKKIKIPSSIRFVSIGPVTSATLKEYGCKPYCQARKYTISGLVEALRSKR